MNTHQSSVAWRYVLDIRYTIWFDDMFYLAARKACVYFYCKYAKKGPTSLSPLQETW